MSFTELLDQVVGRQKKQKTIVLAEYEELIKKIAEGNDKLPAADKVDAILSEADKSPDDLRKDVSHIAKRRDYRRQLDSLPELQSEQEILAAKIQEEQSRFQKLQEEHNKIIRPLIDRQRGIGAAMATAESCRLKLADSYVGPLKTELQTIERDRYTLYQKRLSIERHITDLGHCITDIQDHPEKYDQSEIPSIKKQIDGRKAEIADLEKIGAPLAAREREIEKLMLEV